MGNAYIKLAAVLAAALPLVSAPAPAQTGGEPDLAKRTFMNAEQLMREGKLDQALRDYQQVIQAFPDSPWADDALIRVGSYYYPAESVEDLGSVSAGSQESARPFFVQVRERYPQSDSAPHAYYKLGLMSLDPLNPRRDLDEAYASFYGVVNIYPESDWVAEALLGAAVAELGKRNYDRAILSLERSLEESPHDPPAAESQFYLGVANARLGDFVRAAEAFQACRLADPEGRTAGRALDWLTLIHNMRLRPAVGAAPDLDHDGSFVPRLPTGQDLRGDLDLAVSPAGEIIVADPRREMVMTFGEDGVRTASDPFAEVRRVAFDASGNLVLVFSSRITVGGADFPAARRSGSSVRRIEDAGGAWRSSAGATYVLDLKEGELLRYGADPADPKTIHRDRDAGTRLLAMASGPEDRLYFIDGRGDQVLILKQGSLASLAKPGVGPALEDPVDLAVDALGDVYVLDRGQKAVFVMGPDGKLLAKIAPPDGALAEIASGAAIAVGPKGEIYVYDERKRTILRFR